MTKLTYRNVNIPFEGFYGSRYSDMIDCEESQWVEYEVNERHGDRDGEGEGSQPEALRLTESELVDLLMSHTQYSTAYRKVAEWYCEAFDRECSEAFGFELGSKFEEMISPREYNFGTDRLFVDIPSNVIRKLWAMSKAEGHETLAKMIGCRFTSYDGFHSSYANDLPSWVRKPLSDWDHNELGTLLLACMQIKGLEDDNRNGDDLSWRLYYAVADGDGAYQAWSEAVDWDAFDQAREEARQDKLEELAELDPETAKQLGYEFIWRTSPPVSHPDQMRLI